MTLVANSGAESRFGELIAQLDAIVWEADASSWQFTFVSEAAENILGYPIQQWLSDSNFWADHIHPSDRQRAVLTCQQATARGQDHRFEYRFLAADGRVVWLSDIVRVAKDEAGTPRQLRGVMIDITDRKNAESQLHQIYEQALNIENEERRDIARKLYDSTSQELAALNINLGVIRKSSPSLGPKANKALTECLDLVEACGREIRAFSHLLHPPLLDEFGLATALRSHLENLRKTGLQPRLMIDKRFRQKRLPEKLEITLFRIAQEGLTHLRLHSKWKSATVRLSTKKNSQEIVLQVSNLRRGVPVKKAQATANETALFRIEMSRMRERVLQLGGRFEAITNSRGTMLTAILPLELT
jgi:PAS domain S-box-containing protein